DGEKPTLLDWEIHLSTLFPEVRLKKYIEVRGTDSGEPASCLALAAFLKGILYDGASRRAAWGLVRDMSFKERERLLEDVCRPGPRCHTQGSGCRPGAARPAPPRRRVRPQLQRRATARGHRRHPRRRPSERTGVGARLLVRLRSQPLRPHPRGQP